MERAANQEIDLRGVACPLNWVKTKLRLEEMEPGEVLEVLLDDGDPIRNVPRSVRAEGHRIVAVTPLEGYVKLLVERAT